MTTQQACVTRQTHSYNQAASQTCSKPCSFEVRPSSSMLLRTAATTLGSLMSRFMSWGRPREAAHGSSVSGSGTTTATRLGCRLSPYTKACATRGERWYTFSIFSGDIYSPCIQMSLRQSGEHSDGLCAATNRPSRHINFSCHDSQRMEWLQGALDNSWQADEHSLTCASLNIFFLRSMIFSWPPACQRA